VPNKFEAGTPNIAGSVGLGAAIDYLKGIDIAAMQAYEDEAAGLRHEGAERGPRDPIDRHCV
jgi:cysteine desulfurase/selenocysteine lyase